MSFDFEKEDQSGVGEPLVESWHANIVATAEWLLESVEFRHISSAQEWESEFHKWPDESLVNSDDSFAGKLSFTGKINNI